MTAFSLHVLSLSVCPLSVLCCALSVRCCCVMHMLLLCSVSSADEGALVRFREALTESDGGGFTVRTEISIITQSHRRSQMRTASANVIKCFLADIICACVCLICCCRWMSSQSGGTKTRRVSEQAMKKKKEKRTINSIPSSCCFSCWP